MTPLQRSILETIIYFDLFDYPLTLSELYRYLWRPPARIALLDMERAVNALPQLAQADGLVYVKGRETLGEVREQRYLESERKFRKRRRYLWLLSGLPGVEAIWIVNTMAYHNVRADSDIDLLIVARPGKIWSARFFTTAVAKLLGIRPTVHYTKDTLCLSFYLTSAHLNLSALAAHNHERYEAYWLAQIMPVYDPQALLERCWEVNAWARLDLPNAQPMALHYNRSIRHGWWQICGHAFGRLLLWESVWRTFQLWLLPQRLRVLQGSPADGIVVLSDDLLKFHTIDPRPTILKQFEEHMAQSPIQAMIALMRQAARQEILPRFGHVTGQSKGTAHHFSNMVTEADLHASEFMLNHIRERFPGSYSEEHQHADRFTHDVIWQIDPVDGTDEFCAGMQDGYACLATLLERQPEGSSTGVYSPIASIIYLPGVDKLWYSDGQTVVFEHHGTQQPLAQPTRSELRGWIRQVDPSERLKNGYDQLGQQLQLPVKIIPGGGAGAALAALLEDKVNLVILNYDYSKEWDIAAAEPIVQALGGFVCDLNGQPFQYNRPASPGLEEPYNLHGYVISLAFRQSEILPHLPKDLLEKRLLAVRGS